MKTENAQVHEEDTVLGWSQLLEVEAEDALMHLYVLMQLPG